VTAASGAAGRRASWAPPLLLLGYLLVAPKSFVLGPLALLLLLSRPRTVREWFWIGASAALAWVLLQAPTSLVDRTVRAAGMLFTGAFVITSLVGVRSLFRRALAAVAVAVAGTWTWFAVLGLDWSTLRQTVTAMQWQLYRIAIPALPEAPPSTVDAALGTTAELAANLARGLAATADLWPGLHAVMALGGGWLAWVWYHRVASAPIGRPSPPFRTFTFSDHFVWLVIAAGAATLAPLPDTAALVAANLLLFLLALYAGRGLAVTQTALLPAPTGLAFVLTVAAVLLLPLALVALTLVGLADTWLDLRRRLLAPQGAPP
jgi:hypothetical protein